jgi:predicted nucleic acid-binding Zn ribbon protein
MPVREFGCEGCHKIEEHFRHRADDMTAPECCGKPMRQLISTFGIVFCGDLNRYNDPAKENLNQADGGHYQWRVRSSRSGYPERVLIRTRQEQKEFVRDEGLVDPADIAPNSQISDDGKKMSSQGLPGCWGV